MKCPTDDTTLVMSERSGVEIDYCPQCRGVWLDRGELDKILDRVRTESESAAPATQQATPQRATPNRFDRDISNAQQYDRDSRYRKGKKREHWLMDLFD